MKKYGIYIFLCGTLLAGCSSEKAPPQIEIPEEKIAKFQMGSIRSKPEEYKKLSDFIENMEGAVPEKDRRKHLIEEKTIILSPLSTKMKQRIVSISFQKVRNGIWKQRMETFMEMQILFWIM